MANPEHLDRLKQGAEAWNRWRLENPGVTPDLSQAEIDYVDLQGVNLRGANLQKAKLRGAHLQDADLCQADLRRASLGQTHLQRANLESASLEGANLALAELTGANLRNASLPGVNLTVTDLTGASLREAGLQGANLAMQRGVLRPEQLAGADLAGATLPTALTDLFKDLKAVGDISESARKLFVAMLAACVYSWLTIATTTDVNLITNRASSPLPIIQTSIPIVGFYVVAPLLLLCVYFYFHFYLQKLWEELGSLPAIFPDGRPLHARSDPWLLNDLVRSHLAKLKADRPFMSYFQQAISMVLAWWLVPITLLLFWGRYLPRHDYSWLGTKLHVALLAISITAAIFLYRLATGTLRGAERRPFSWRRAVKSRRAYGVLAIFAATGVAFVLVSLGAIRGVPPDRRPWWESAYPRAAGSLWSRRYGWVPRAMALVHYSPFANLRDPDVSIKPANWTGDDEKELALVKGADLAGADLRYAHASGAFLAKTNFGPAGETDTRMEGADLDHSDLRQADLGRAHLNRARLFFARLNSARLNGAYLNGAILGWAHLNNAELDGADLTGADLVGADLTGADLSLAHLVRAKLTKAHLTKAMLGSADLTLARLNGADLTGADLSRANLSFANFRMNGQSVQGKTKGLTAEALKTADNWDKAFYDDDLLKILFPDNWRDHNQKLEEQQNHEEQTEARPAGGSTETPGQTALPASGQPANPKP